MTKTLPLFIYRSVKQVPPIMPLYIKNIANPKYPITIGKFNCSSYIFYFIIPECNKNKKELINPTVILDWIKEQDKGQKLIDLDCTIDSPQSFASNLIQNKKPLILNLIFFLLY